MDAATSLEHSHSFLGESHAKGERKTWAVIALCGAMMVIEIAGGLLFGSIALVADGLHMSTHAGALLLAALAYTYARRHAGDARFTFGTGKLGDLAGFTSAIILAMISILIGYEAASRFSGPVPIHFGEAIPIAFLGLAVNVASAWLLSGAEHHDHSYVHGHHQAHDEVRRLETAQGTVILEIFEEELPPRFRLRAESGPLPAAADIAIETIRPDGVRQLFTMSDRGAYLESIESIPEPHEFRAIVRVSCGEHPAVFEEHEHAGEKAHRDNNLRAAVLHVIADATVSVCVIIALLLAWTFGWQWTDPAAGIVGAFVIASWSYALIRDTGVILLDMNPDQKMAGNLRQAVEHDGDQLADLHLWRLGPGHLGAILLIGTKKDRGPDYYRARLSRFRSLSHLTIEVRPLQS
jgi:cation diffusion facilitator family transporter